MYILLLLAALIPTCVHHPSRSTAVRHHFERVTGFPHGRVGYVVDHIIPLCLGGPDSIDNMQWQSRAESYKKDRIERQQCRQICKKGRDW